MKVILAVIGSREMKDYTLFEREMDKWVAEHGAPDEIVSGGAQGADTLGHGMLVKRASSSLCFGPTTIDTRGTWLR